MIESLNLQNFRSHKELNLTGLGRVNLLLGRNNSGKTAVLEALFLVAWPEAASASIKRLSDARSQGEEDLKELWAGLFHDREYDRPIVIRWEDDAELFTQQVLVFKAETTERFSEATSPSIAPYSALDRINFSRSNGNAGISVGNFSLGQKVVTSRGKAYKVASYLPARGLRDMGAEAMRYSALEVEGRGLEIEAALRIIDPELSDLTVVALSKSSALYASSRGERLMPISLMGDGVLRMLSIALSLSYSRNGILLIDEVENGLHYTVQENVWRLIIETSQRLNVQVFVTTHSDECLAAASRAAHSLNAMDDVCAYRLDRKGPDMHVASFSGEDLGFALASGFEVR